MSSSTTNAGAPLPVSSSLSCAIHAARPRRIVCAMCCATVWLARLTHANPGGDSRELRECHTWRLGSETSRARMKRFTHRSHQKKTASL